jgi:tRNA pseudouridine65 synthase
VRGWPAVEGTINRPLAAVEDQRIGPQPADPRESQTAFRRIATFELPVCVDRYPTSRYALVELNPLTGRRHQLRRHLTGESHPIVGDSTYGKGGHNRLFRAHYGSHRLLLACTQLALRHPASGALLVVDAPLAAEFATVVRQMGWPVP